jgi:hypothetical protein
VPLIPDEIWRGDLEREMGDRPVFAIADRLRAGEIHSVVAGWQHDEVMLQLSQLEQRLERLEARQTTLASSVRGFSAAAAFAAIREMNAG